MRTIIAVLVAGFVSCAYAQDTFDPNNKSGNINLGNGNLQGAICNIATTLTDGCGGAQAHGTIVDAHLADAKQVIDLNVNGGSGYTNGTFTWTSSGGGCSRNATGTITVSGGNLGGGTRGDLYTITDGGSDCTSRPTIAIPAGASGGSGGSIIPTVYQLTPHNCTVVTACNSAVGSNWNVPGVDYPVGYDITLALKDPTSAGLPSGCTFSSPTVTCAGSGGVLNGYDFTLHNTHLTISANGWTISNNSFICGPHNTATSAMIRINSGVTNATMKYNSMNGGDTLPLGGAGGTVCDTTTLATILDNSQVSGTFTFEYNYCYNFDAKCINFELSTATNSLIVIEKYNYYGEIGLAGSTHGEAEYAYKMGATNQTINWTLEYNVAITHYYAGPTNATSPLSQVGDDFTLATTTDHNFGLARGTQSYTGSNNGSSQTASASLFCGHQTDPGAGSASGTIKNNLWDYSGAFDPYNPSGSTCAGDFPGLADFNAGTGNSCNTSTCN